MFHKMGKEILGISQSEEEGQEDVCIKMGNKPLTPHDGVMGRGW